MEIIKREDYVERIVRYLGKGLIIVLTGQRRAGKSCIMQSVVEHVRQNDTNSNTIYINKEYSEFKDIRTDEDLNEYVEGKLLPDVRNYLFLDEVQDIKGFENSLRNFQAKDACEIIVTGSNARMLSGELATYLSGRYVELHIHSLSYSEFLLFHRLADSDDAFTKYLVWGGLPQLAHIGLENSRMATDYLGDVYNTVIMKDVISRENIRNVRFLTDLVCFVADNTGKNVSANSIRKFMLSQHITISPTLTSNYLSYLCNAYIIRQVPRYDIHGKRLFETNEKYYFEDIGLRNAVTGVNLITDIEKLLENVVYLHLLRQGYSVTVGQLQNGEVDFVAQRDGKKLYVQVCYLLSSQETINREFGNLHRIRDSYPKMVICMDHVAVQGSYEGIDCRHIRDFVRTKIL